MLCDPIDCSLPDSSVHGTLKARILEWVAMPSSRGSFWPRDRTHISFGSCIAGSFFTTEPLGKPIYPEKIIIQKDTCTPNVHCSTIYNSQDMEATYMFISGEIGKEAVIYTYNEILLSHKKEWNCSSCSMVDGPKVRHTEVSQKKKISYIKPYMWNLEKWYWWTICRAEMRCRHREWTCGQAGGRREWDELRE